MIGKRPASSSETISGDGLLTIEGVYRSFLIVMNSYRRFIPIMLQFTPLLSSAIGESRLAVFAKSNGELRKDLSKEDVEVYELKNSLYAEFVARAEEVAAAAQGANHFPQMMVIGLISSYDAFISQLLKAVANKHNELLLTKDEQIKYSDLIKYPSIEAARDAIIEQNIESVLRTSHQEQFSWMENRFSMQLHSDLPVWPKFIELCERRNLLTHTGGIVSRRYIENCNAHKCDIGDIKVGDRLIVSTQYFGEAVKIIYEIGAKLCHVFWRKFAKEEREKADTELNMLGFNLIYQRAYDLAEIMLHFGVDVIKTYSSESVRRMMIINLANAWRLRGRTEDAKKLVEKEDWSGWEHQFRICVASIKGEVDTVVSLMREIGASGRPSLEEYRSWPVFRGICENEKFVATFEEVFGESFISSQAVEITLSAAAESTETPSLENSAGGVRRAVGAV